MNNRIRTSRFAALNIAVVGIITVTTGQSATATAPSAERLAWCTDTSLLPRTPDAAEAWLRACQGGDGANDLLPTNPDAAEAWLR